MVIERACATAAGLIGAMTMVAFAPVAARAQEGPVVIKPNVQVSDPLGPDGAPGGGDDDPKAQNETPIAASPTTTGVLLVGANDLSFGIGFGYRLGFMASSNGGQTWFHDISADENGDPIDLPAPDNCDVAPGWLDGQWDPGVAIGGNGYMYMAGFIEDVTSGFGHVGLFFARLHESDIDLSPAPWKCDTIRGTCPGEKEPDKPLISADRSTVLGRRDRVYVHWSYFGGPMPEIWFLASHTAGQDFLGGTSNDPIVLDRGTRGSPQGPASAVGPDGEVYVTWIRRWIAPGEGLNSAIAVCKSTDGGLSFATAVECAQLNEISEGATFFDVNYAINSYPAIAVDCSPCASRGSVYIVYADESIGAQSDIKLVYSTDGAENWSAPVTVNDVTTNDQYFPWVAVDDYGRVGVMWLDKRDDPDNHRYNMYFAFSDNGGVTWSQSYQVTDPNEISDPRYPLSPFFIGDYIGLTAQHDTFYGAWCDLRNWDGGDPTEAGDVFLGRMRLSVPDFEHDCDVDLDDYGVFAACFNGSGRPPAPTCPPGADADLDGDGDVDLDDFAIFQQKYTGAANCWCPGTGGAEGPYRENGQSYTLSDQREWLAAYCAEHNIPFN